MPLTGKNIVLGVCGSVACYRACDLARELMRRGATVRTCLTDAAANFVSPVLFESLTGQPCLNGVFEEPERGRMAHIDWARWADLVVVAPATANCLNKLAAGVADDMLTSLALAYEGPLVVAPAMNPSMFAHEATARSYAELEARGAWVVEPAEGDVACGEQGQGKLASVPTLVDAVEAVAQVTKSLTGKHVLVTSGPTHEPLDDVRFIGNRSSGKMGAALARAALWMGARVTMVTGPTSVPIDRRATVVRVTTAKEMLAAAFEAAADADVAIGAAAVADFAPVAPVKGKIRREDGVPVIELTANPDVIAELAKVVPLTVAFAAEPDEGLDHARAKLARKGVAAVAVNDVSRADIGFESNENELTLVTATTEERSGRGSKLRCALWLLERISQF